MKRGMIMRYAISSCLMGLNCKYSGGNNANEQLISFLKDKAYICVCPEVLGGLPIPRACAERRKDIIINTNSENVSEQFMKGAELALMKVQNFHVDIVILQPRSPSCGVGEIYDGSFTNRLIEGNGMFAQSLLNNGIKAMNIDVFLEENFK